MVDFSKLLKEQRLKKTNGKQPAGKALVKWDEELARLSKLATKTEENVGAEGNTIGTANGRFKYKGVEIPGGKMRVVIVHHILANLWYTSRYDPNNPTAPACFAFAENEDEMAPHEKATDPQSESCTGCEQNEYGTSSVGKGKACKNSRRLALLVENDLEDVAAAEVAYLHIPPTSLKGWAGYVRQIDELLNRPPLGVITEITISPDEKTQFRIDFKLAEAIDDGDVIGALLDRRKVLEKEINWPYIQIENAQPTRQPKQLKGGRPVPAAKGKVKAKAKGFAGVSR